jgi:hypothetical protein
MKFAVRYWSSFLPKVSGEIYDFDEHPHWIDYSLHPASKLGLHNALLAVYDRLEILKAHGGRYDCAIFVLENGTAERLSREIANKLFTALPRGEVQWLDIKKFLLPIKPEVPAITAPPLPPPPNTPPPSTSPPACMAHTHTGYDDLDIPPHLLDIDV